MTPSQYCREKVCTAGSSFYYSTLFLAPVQRDAITTVHAYAREIIEVLDECHEPAIARAKLDWWRHEIRATLDGDAHHPVCKALIPVLEDHNLPESELIELIDGVEASLNQSRYQTYQELSAYCRRIGAPVGMLSASVLECTSSATAEFARELGFVFQLTRVVRDMRLDARRGRVYVPAQELAQFDVPVAHILNGVESENFYSLMAFQFDRIAQGYEHAMARLPERDRLQLLPALILTSIYRATLDEIRNDGYRLLQHRVTLPPLRKLWIAWRTQRREKRRNKRLRG